MSLFLLQQALFLLKSIGCLLIANYWPLVQEMKRSKNSDVVFKLFKPEYTI